MRLNSVKLSVRHATGSVAVASSARARLAEPFPVAVRLTEMERK